MSTRCRIGILGVGGTIKSIYCHHDGYVNGVGKELVDSYKDPDKIHRLLNLGDISSLGSEPVSIDCQNLNFDIDSLSSYTLAYKSRGEDCPAKVSEDKEDYYNLSNDCGCNYAYLFYPSKKAWRFYNSYSRKEYWVEDYLDEFSLNNKEE